MKKNLPIECGIGTVDHNANRCYPFFYPYLLIEDRMIERISVRIFTEEEINFIISKMKEKHKEIWDRIKLIESRDGTLSEVKDGLMGAIISWRITNNLSDITKVVRIIRKEARKEAGLPV